MTELACQFCGAVADVVYARHSEPGHRYAVRCDHQSTCPMIIDGWATAIDAVDAWTAANTPKATPENKGASQ